MAHLVRGQWCRVGMFALLCNAVVLVAPRSWAAPASQSRLGPGGAEPPSGGGRAASEEALEQPPDRGATYEWLESQATRVTIRFPDAVAIVERTGEASLDTRLTDLIGNDVATFTVRRVDATSDALEFRSTDSGETRALERLRSRPALDWAGRQAYSFWKDRRALAASLSWSSGLLRPRGASARDLEREVVELRTEWPGGLEATATRVDTRRNVLTGGSAGRRSLISRLRKDNAEVGHSRWYVEEQVLEWSFPGLTEGYLDSARLQPVGGWPFTPDMAWVNVQSFAFRHFHSLVATQGFVARRQDSWKDTVLRLVMPIVSANEPGCDGLHWLDRSVFRPCCDVHDRCYEKYGCSSRSWWRWWSSWTCSSCNVGATFCFASGGKSPYYPSPY